MYENKLENPVLGYVVVAAAMVVGMLSATVFGHPPATASRSPVFVPDSPPASESLDRVDIANERIANERIANEQGLLATFSGDYAIPSPRSWILGVRSMPTATGCVVTAVVNGSPAERGGLVIGDRILNVDGKQVGWLGHQLVELFRAVDASPGGKARLLVQHSGSCKIESIEIQMHTINQSMGH